MGYHLKVVVFVLESSCLKTTTFNNFLNVGIKSGCECSLKWLFYFHIFALQADKNHLNRLFLLLKRVVNVI